MLISFVLEPQSKYVLSQWSESASGGRVKGPCFGCPGTHKKLHSKSSEFDSFLPWQRLSTLGQCMCNNSAASERFLCRKVSQDGVCSQAESCPGLAVVSGAWRAGPRRSLTPRGRLCRPDVPGNKKGPGSSDLTNQRKWPTSWADWNYFTLSTCIPNRNVQNNTLFQKQEK